MGAGGGAMETIFTPEWVGVVAGMKRVVCWARVTTARWGWCSDSEGVEYWVRVVWSVARRARRSGLESEERRVFMLVLERIVKGILKGL